MQEYLMYYTPSQFLSKQLLACTCIYKQIENSVDPDQLASGLAW